KIADIGAFIPTYMVPYTREAAWAYVRLPDDIAPKRAGSLFDPMGLGTLWIDKNIQQQIKNKEKLAPETVIDKRYRI
ncbi:MAG: ABC transporter substrate-binding protein, partial [Gammaproteobacteria bacterium]